ncbi:DEAD/DEAH box helicase [Metabacillus indicus]|uniref:DEAD/DEAH box helicase n=1 Tax=Metabacillus indicus TaxID=246786 RepID=UPI00316ECA73
MNSTWSMLEEAKPFLKEAWEKASYTTPTAIQEKAVPAILDGRDVIAESPTGTGKTLAYLLPVLQRINPESKNIQTLIMASSRELVMQIHEEIQKWSAGSGILGASFIGGANVKRQLEKLKKRPQIIVGTPGRVYELINQKKIKMHEVKTIVLDEGDQLLQPEHLSNIKNIIKTTLKDRQLLLFSATLPEKTEAEAKKLMQNPELIKISRGEAVQSDVEHIYFPSEQRDKIDLLQKLSRVEGTKAIAFVKDIGNAAVLAEKLMYKGIELGILHGDSSKRERELAMKSFRTGEISMLLATDVAARGLDIEGVTHVIHYDLPETSEQYVHRSGRTGRNGASGTVVSLVTEREERELKQLCRNLKIELHKKRFYHGEVVDSK